MSPIDIAASHRHPIRTFSHHQIRLNHTTASSHHSTHQTSPHHKSNTNTSRNFNWSYGSILWVRCGGLLIIFVSKHILHVFYFRRQCCELLKYDSEIYQRWVRLHRSTLCDTPRTLTHTHTSKNTPPKKTNPNQIIMCGQSGFCVNHPYTTPLSLHPTCSQHRPIRFRKVPSTGRDVICAHRTLRPPKQLFAPMSAFNRHCVCVCVFAGL